MQLCSVHVKNVLIEKIYNKTIVLKSFLVLKRRVCFGTLFIHIIFFFSDLFIILPWKINKNEI